MSNPILVTYAGRFGSTEEVARAIAAELAGDEQPVECRPLDDVQGVEAYRAVVLGSAVNYGAWLPAAADFARVNEAGLADRPVALFTVHIQNIGNDAQSRGRRHAYLEKVRPHVAPVSEAFFAGRFNRHAARELLPRWLAWLVPTLDFRKWDQIRAWARETKPLLL